MLLWNMPGQRHEWGRKSLPNDGHGGDGIGGGQYPKRVPPFLSGPGARAHQNTDTTVVLMYPVAPWRLGCLSAIH